MLPRTGTRPGRGLPERTWRQGDAPASRENEQTGRSGGGSGSPSAKTRQATFSGRGNRERSPSSIRSARGTDVGRARCHRRWFRAPARCRPEASAPLSRALHAGWRYDVSAAALTLAERGVIGAGFALPRDAGRRPALQCCAMRVIGGEFRPLRGRCRSEGPHRENWPALPAVPRASSQSAIRVWRRPCVRAGYRR